MLPSHGVWGTDARSAYAVEIDSGRRLQQAADVWEEIIAIV